MVVSLPVLQAAVNKMLTVQPNDPMRFLVSCCTSTHAH